MAKELCPKYEKCPLFNNTLLERQQSTDTYKELYCIAGKEKFETCMRFIVAKKFGKAPDFVLPNSKLSIELIEEKMKRKGMLS